MKKNKTTRHDRTKRRPRAIIIEAIDCFIEASKLYPGQDPIRLAAGIKDLKLPLSQTMTVLRKLAPHFKGDQADMIRLAAGFNDLRAKIKEDRIAQVIKVMTK